ncbi:hypothetical protein [Cytophaga sp. FL35]|uniref:hypothetical protein n=1 Tax=Cytophaga sp. FL35 TaxID=1904456 RepID=UPI0016538A5D|nr:hypothetical protein [Cytophaga sp. FL35]MBC7000897.1 hypothetical protein [Cytophaga sp. FL35]
MNFKLKLLFTLLILTIASCGKQNSKKKINILSEQNLKLKDSIENLLRTKESKFLSDSVKIDFSKGILGVLNYPYYSDTLVLSARFADCGEFGGHKEYLKIYVADEKYICLFINKSIDCSQSYSKYTKIDTLTYELNEINQKRVLDYLLKLTEVSMLQQDLITNFSNYYEIEQLSGYTKDFDILESHEKRLHFRDQSLKWKEFEKLRENIKTTANTGNRCASP